MTNRGIHTRTALRRFLIELREEGLNFHPDTPFSDYVNRDGKPSYTPEQINVRDNLLDESFAYCDANGLDIYEVAMEIFNQPAPEGVPS